MQSVSWIDPTLLQDLKACCCSVPSSCKKAESTACLTTHRQERSLLPLQSVDVFEEIRIGEQWVEGEEGGVPRDHRGCEHRRTAVRNDCSTSPGNRRETFPRYLRKLRMLYINSCTTPILRAAVNNKYMACNRHVLILQYFIVEFQ